MARHIGTQLSANCIAVRTMGGQTNYARRLRFEPLEDRRMLSIIADGFDPTFAQVSLASGGTTNNETAILTVDPAGHFAVFYQPNTELGYINPATGDLLTLSQFPGTSNVSVIDAVVGGNGTIDSGLTNVSQLAGLHYANGQIIASNGGLTLFHEDGSSLRSGTTGATWTYDGGANFITFSINYMWSNTRFMKSTGTYRHPNNIIVRNNTGSIFYAANTTFDNNTTGEEFYPASVALKNTAGIYSYETGAQLDNSNVISYPTGATMIAANGNVFNADGSPATTPFTQHDTFTNSEVTTTVSNGDYAITIAATQTVSGSLAAYVTRINPVYPVSGDYNANGHVDAADYVLWRKNLASVTSLPNDNTPGVGDDDYVRWRANFGQIAIASGAGAGLGQTLADTGSVAATQSVLPTGQMAAVLPMAVASELSVVSRRVESDKSITLLNQSAPALELLTVVGDWQQHASITNDLAPISAIDTARQISVPTLNTVDDAFASLATTPLSIP